MSEQNLDLTLDPHRAQSLEEWKGIDEEMMVMMLCAPRQEGRGPTGHERP